MLAVPLLFFTVIRMDVPQLYSYVLDVLTTIAVGLGISTQRETVKAYMILGGFIVTALSASLLLYFGIHEFRTSPKRATQTDNDAQDTPEEP